MSNLFRYTKRPIQKKNAFPVNRKSCRAHGPQHRAVIQRPHRKKKGVSTERSIQIYMNRYTNQYEQVYKSTKKDFSFDLGCPLDPGCPLLACYEPLILARGSSIVLVLLACYEPWILARGSSIVLVLLACYELLILARGSSVLGTMSY